MKCPRCQGLFRYDSAFPGFVCCRCGRVVYSQDGIINDRAKPYAPGNGRRGRTGQVITPTNEGGNDAMHKRYT